MDVFDLGTTRRHEEKGMTEDEMVGWITDSMDVSLSKLQVLVMDRDPAPQAWATRQAWVCSHMENRTTFAGSPVT